jgi:quercetin dioxygenase-like cupin family protein
MLNFNTGHSFSMHFHKEKDETWYVLSGKFQLTTINTTNAEQLVETLHAGDVKHIPPMLPHQLLCLEAGTVIEVSTPDSVEDNYRMWRGQPS